MTTLRKTRHASSYTPPCPEAFDYDADVTKEAVRKIQDHANKCRGDDELEVIEGYVGQPRK
jgi:hypothetical protein